MTKITIDKALLEQAIEALPDVLGMSHFPLRTKLREALAQQQAVMRQALDAIADLAGYRTDVDKAIKALEEALK